jgi:hypothetical protein
MNNHDPLFTFLTCSPLRTRMQRGSDLLSKEVSFLVNDQLAMHLQSNDWQIGSALLKFHKQELCKFAAAAVMLGYKGGAKSALYVWLKERGVGEDDYSLETAYKLWQRFGWKIVSGKSTTFLGQKRGKAALILAGKTARMPKPTKAFDPNNMTLSEIDVELAAHRFTTLIFGCNSLYRHLLESKVLLICVLLPQVLREPIATSFADHWAVCIVFQSSNNDISISLVCGRVREVANRCLSCGLSRDIHIAISKWSNIRKSRNRRRNRRSWNCTISRIMLKPYICA